MTNPASYTILMFRSFFRPALVAIAVIAMTGCGDDPVDTPTGPTPQPLTEVFTGTLTVNGAVTHPFSATTAGSLTATLSNIVPDENPTVGLSLGTWNGSACAVVISTDAAVRTTVVYGTVNQPGQLCVRIYDVGRIASANDYEITVVHP
jgi:hypothetical protein